jgi:predicted nuclease with TOPRIM domain
MSQAKTMTLERLAEMVAAGNVTAKEWRDEIKADLQQKHEENRERRHVLGSKLEEVQNRAHVLGERVGALETKLFSIVGDNSGGSGLLHDIDKKVDALKGEVEVIKQTVQNTPAINKWVYGAIGVIGFLIVVVPIVFGLLFEMFRLLVRH